MVWTMEPNSRAGNRFSGRNQFWADSSTPFRMFAAAAASITARDANGLSSETRCCDIQPRGVVRQTASDARPRSSSRAFQREPGDQASASQGLGQVEQASSFSRLFHPSSAILYYFRPLGGSNVTWQFRRSEIEYRFQKGKTIGESLFCP